jgi:hypothetical protein
MNPVTLNFIRRWNWVFVIHFAATTLGWILYQEGAKLHFEMLAAVAMSMDFTRGLVRPCLGLPVTRAVLARGLWFAVAAVSPVLTLLSMIAATGFCLIFRTNGPSWGLMSYHLIISVLLSGTMQFLLTSLPVRPPATLSGRIRDTVIGLAWGLSLSATLWISFMLPAGWDGIHASGWIILFLLAGLSTASWFTTRSMLVGRAETRAAVPETAVQRTTSAALSGSSGWWLWFQLELGLLVPLSAMFVIIMGMMEGMARLSSSGVSAAIRGSANAWLTLGLMCSMITFPLFARAVGAARVFRAMPITLNQQALLLTARPLIYCLALFSMFGAVSLVVGRASGELWHALSIFLLVGSLMSLSQAGMVRFPRFPVAVSMGVLLAPAMVIAMPILLRQEIPFYQLAAPGAVCLVLSWWLHRRWLLRSSEFYRSQGWLALIAKGNNR